MKVPGKPTKMLTCTGKVFDFLDVDENSICIEDIAHALALTNRYGGHTNTFYSVAEHCVRMSFKGMPGDPLVNLLHDAAEAYLGDIPSPLKRNLGWNIDHQVSYLRFLPFEKQEKKILRKIWKALGLKYREHPLTKKADLIMLVTEIRDLMPDDPLGVYEPYKQKAEPLIETIYPWFWATAEEKFLQRFEELTG